MSDSKSEASSGTTATGTTSRKERLTKDLISPPTNFEHVVHRSKADMEDFMAQLEADVEGSATLVRSRFDVDLASLRRLSLDEEDGLGGGSGGGGRLPPKSPKTASLPDLTRLTVHDPQQSPKTSSTVSASASISSIQQQPARRVSTDTVVVNDVEESFFDELERKLETELAGEVHMTSKTADKAVSAKVWVENHFVNMMRGRLERESRRQRLEEELSRNGAAQALCADLRKRLYEKETDYMRLRRLKVSRQHFDDIKTIGRGAFGEVKLVREKETGRLLAMKCLKKAEMVKKRQEGHVRAERDLLAAATNSPSIVRLYHSFQDKEMLYLVMEYMGGGDLLNLLIKMDVFPEDFARFYVAEMVLAIGQVHRLGFVHRDVKPDNFLLSQSGHLKISDFGLCTGFHWTHDAKYYESQRKATAKLLENKRTELIESNAQAVREMEEAEDMAPRDRILFWRKQNRKSMAYSVVGTNNYIAPEVLLQVGYGFECDWWSLGVILYEMLFGFPPFCSDSRQNTKLKIVNWRQTLRFPSKPKVSPEAKHLIQSLICDHSDRLGRNSVEDVMNHPFFKSISFETILQSQAPWTPQLTSPTDTRCFDNFDEEDAHAAAPGAAGGPGGAATAGAAAPSKPVVPDGAAPGGLPQGEADAFAFHGYTHRGFFDLTRKSDARSGNQTMGPKMDTLQAAVLAQLNQDGVLDQIRKTGF